jgi:aspartate racemase
MTQHIGIVACSAEGAALCYRTICEEAPAAMGAHSHPEITMHTFPLSQYMQCIYADNWDGVGDLMHASAAKLVSVGAQLLICPDNTIHQAFDRATSQIPVPWLHIADEVARVAQEKGLRKLGVLGTRYLMEGPVYATRLNAAAIEVLMPPADHREHINDIIFDELVYGKFESESKKYFQGLIAAMKHHGCDGVGWAVPKFR